MFSQADRYRAGKKYQDGLRQQYTLTLGGLFFSWRAHGGERALFFDAVLKVLLEGNLRVIGRRRPKFSRDESWELIVDPAWCRVRFAVDGTSCLVPSRLIIEDTEDEIQWILDSCQYLFADLRFSKTEAERLWPPQPGIPAEMSTAQAFQWMKRKATPPNAKSLRYNIKREAAGKMLQERFDGMIPSKEELGDTALVREVEASAGYEAAKKCNRPSRETILRAAKRLH